MMADLEKAIRILEQNYSHGVFRSKDELIPVTEIISLLKASQQMLRAQEPRVLTLEEAKVLKRDTVVWYEHIGANGLRPRIVYYSCNEFTVFTDGGKWSFETDCYGKRFRYWISRPTDEQRKATPWE